MTHICIHEFVFKNEDTRLHKPDIGFAPIEIAASQPPYGGGRDAAASADAGAELVIQVTMARITRADDSGPAALEILAAQSKPVRGQPPGARLVLDREPRLVTRDIQARTEDTMHLAIHDHEVALVGS